MRFYQRLNVSKKDLINEANDLDLQFTIDVDLLLEVMLLEIRGTSLKFSSTLKKEKLNRERTLMKLIERSESCISNPICTRVRVKSFEDLDLKDLNPFYKGFERI